MSKGVGADIQARCGKCGDVWHVIVAKVADGIAKVQCKECSAYHRYRPVAGAAAQPRARAASSRKSASASRKKPEPVAEVVEPDLSKPVKTYSIRETFEVRERIDHPKFGVGVVESSPGPGKVSVMFPGGRRILAQAKPAAAGLSKPPRPGWTE